MEILALEPYYGGSHRAFLDGWAAASRHRFTVLDLPAGKWKWRMRHGAMTLARRAAALAQEGRRWDLVWCSDMLDLAQLRGLAPPALRDLPAVVYFHENQLTYPVQAEKERDLHFALTNLTTALAADGVWFNSGFHRDELLAALPRLLQRMPDHRPRWAIDAISARARVEPPGIDEPERRPREVRSGSHPDAPLRLLWAARWEHDKDPEALFDAAELLAATGVDFRLDVVGETFARRPPVFDAARRRLGDRIGRWGFQPRDEYRRALAEADVVISTARHEFFGLALVEAVAAGCYPLVPRRLSYPEVLAPLAAIEGEEIFYPDTDDSAPVLARSLAELDRRRRRGTLWRSDPEAGTRSMERFGWSRRAPALDAAADGAAHPDGTLRPALVARG